MYVEPCFKCRLILVVDAKCAYATISRYRYIAGHQLSRKTCICIVKSVILAGGRFNSYMDMELILFLSSTTKILLNKCILLL